MAENKESANGPKKNGWKKVTKQFQVQGGAKREAAAVTLNEFGHTMGNAEGSAILFRSAMAQGIDPTREFLIDFAVNEERQSIATWATTQATEGTTTVRLYKSGGSSWVSFHLGGAFAEAPDLRPTIKETRVLVHEELDENGIPMMVIPVKSGLAKNTQSRDTPGSQSAASEEK